MAPKIFATTPKAREGVCGRLGFDRGVHAEPGPKAAPQVSHAKAAAPSFNNAEQLGQ